MKKPYLLLGFILVVLVGALAVVRGVRAGGPDEEEEAGAPGNGVVEGRARPVRQDAADDRPR